MPTDMPGVHARVQSVETYHWRIIGLGLWSVHTLYTVQHQETHVADLPITLTHVLQHAVSFQAQRAVISFVCACVCGCVRTAGGAAAGSTGLHTPKLCSSKGPCR